MEATSSKTCGVGGTTCAGNGLECAIKHTGIAEVYCEEASTRSDLKDCRRRVNSAYDQLSHVSDIHLCTSHPKLAKKARDLRKTLEPVIFGRDKSCPPHGTCEKIAEFKQELIHELEKWEHHGHEVQEVEMGSAMPLLTTREGTDNFDWFLGFSVLAAVGFIIYDTVRKLPMIQPATGT